MAFASRLALDLVAVDAAALDAGMLFPAPRPDGRGDRGGPADPPRIVIAGKTATAMGAVVDTGLGDDAHHHSRLRHRGGGDRRGLRSLEVGATLRTPWREPPVGVGLDRVATTRARFGRHEAASAAARRANRQGAAPPVKYRSRRPVGQELVIGELRDDSP